MREGIVAAVLGPRCVVLAERQAVPCVLRGKLLRSGVPYPVVVWDRVEYEALAEDQRVRERGDQGGSGGAGARACQTGTLFCWRRLRPCPHARAPTRPLARSRGPLLGRLRGGEVDVDEGADGRGGEDRRLERAQSAGAAYD